MGSTKSLRKKDSFPELRHTVRILSVQEHPHRKDLLNLTFSDDTSLIISREIYLKEHLSAGTELSAEDLSSLTSVESHHRCHQASLDLLKYRPRSELELKQKLLRKGFSADVIDGTVRHLRDIALVDDRAFASAWADSRKASRSRRLIKMELHKKGIPKDMSEEATSGMDEEATALALAQKKARTLKGESPREFQVKIVNHLLRKGFDFDMSKRVARRVLNDVLETRSNHEESA